jgi:CheY-like chemotaxis protein
MRGDASDGGQNTLARSLLGDCYMAKFLVVDDEPNTVSALRQLLQDDGHEVDAFTSSHEALRALAHGSFDAVLTDFEMPRVRGDVVVRTARVHHPTACVFASTAKARTAAIEGACHVFEKPLDYRWVTSAIAECRARRGPGVHGNCYMKSDKP